MSKNRATLLLPPFYPEWMVANLDSFERAFQFWLSRKRESVPNWLIPMLEHSLFPGRRTRPVLMLEIAKHSKIDDSDKILKAAFSIELLHRAAILLDDLFDQEPKRRLQNTFCKQYDSEATILFSHYLVSFAFEELFALNPKLHTIDSTFILFRKIIIGEYGDIRRVKELSILEQFELALQRTIIFFELIYSHLILVQDDISEDTKQLLNLLGRYFQMSNDIFDVSDLAKSDRVSEDGLVRLTLSYPIVRLIELGQLNSSELFKLYPINEINTIAKKFTSMFNIQELIKSERDRVISSIQLLHISDGLKKSSIDFVNLCSVSEYWSHAYKNQSLYEFNYS